jgi:hypothetical protein
MAKTREALPKWFSRYNEPRKPDKPPETIRKFVPLVTENCNYETLEIPEGVTHITVEVKIDGYGDTDTKVSFGNFVEEKNPHYAMQMKYYKQALAEYKERHPIWVKLMAKLKEEESQKVEAEKRRLYNQLKKEFSDA